MKTTPREIVVKILLDVYNNKSYNNITLKKYFEKNEKLTTLDKSFITEIVNGTIKNQIHIDYIIDRLITIKFNKIEDIILNILRSAIYQIKFMDKVPESAACNEAVKLAKKMGFARLSGFVNGVLRNFIRTMDSISYPDYKKEPIRYLSVIYSYPEWIIKMWLKDYSFEFVKQMCIAGNKIPSISICTNKIKINKTDLIQQLENENIIVEQGNYVEEALTIKKTSNIHALTVFKNGCFHIQDESSMLAIKVLDPKEKEIILDVCAAPGGKTFYCAEKMNNSGQVLARDIYDHKIQLLEESKKRLDLSIIQIDKHDATIVDHDLLGKMDRVLVDAPCSGLGIIRKKPDIKYNKELMDIDNLVQIQRDILTVSSEYVKKDGVLVYSTCTISKKENIENVEWFVKNFNFELEDITNYLPQNLLSVLKDNNAKNGYVQIYPTVGNIDGFFIARFRKK